MRKIVAGLFISLDGVVEAPGTWHFPYFNDEMAAAVTEQVEASDTMLLGRVSYEEFAGFWPQQGSEVELADRMNGVPKLVVSSTLDNVDAWQNSTLIPGDTAVEALTTLKAGAGKNISIVGSPTLVRTLLHEGLVDELDLLVHPIVIGSGKRLFPDGSDRQPLELARADTFKTGVMRLVYRPAAAA
jgi:dihydrofolate reductase